MSNDTSNDTIKDTYQDLIKRNPSIYGLYVTGYDPENGGFVYSKPSEFAIRKAKRDIEHFNQCQEGIRKRTRIAEGDFVILKDGTTSRVTVGNLGDSVQVGGSSHSRPHISKNGSGSYSGVCGAAIKKSSLIDTGEYREGNCWIFSDGLMKAHNGVNSTLDFKVWKQVK